MQLLAVAGGDGLLQGVAPFEVHVTDGVGYCQQRVYNLLVAGFFIRFEQGFTSLCPQRSVSQCVFLVVEQTA